MSVNRRRGAMPKLKPIANQLTRNFLEGKRRALMKPLRPDTSTNPTDMKTGARGKTAAYQPPPWVSSTPKPQNMKGPYGVIKAPQGPANAVPQLLRPATDTRAQNAAQMEVLRRQRRAQMLSQKEFSLDPKLQPDPHIRLRNAQLHLDPNAEDPSGRGKRKKATLRVAYKRKRKV